MKTLIRWMVLIVILAGCLTGCDRHARIISGSYVAGAMTGSTTIASIFIDRKNETVWLHFGDGAVVIAPYTARPRTAWPAGCPANLGSTRMEVLDLSPDDLGLADTPIGNPVLVRNCPPDPVEIVLREAGEIGGAGTACAGAETCLPFPWSSESDALPRSMKGYELYSWRAGAGAPWTYTLVTGTNHNKAWDEISAPGSTISLDGFVKLRVSGEPRLRSILSRLPKGAEVFWIGSSGPQSSADVHDRIAMPDAKTVQGLDSYARRLGLRLYKENTR